MLKCHLRSLKLCVLLCIVLTEIHLSNLAALDDRIKPVSKLRTSDGEEKALELWMNDGNWCALDEYGRTVCSKQSNINFPGEERCQQQSDVGNLFEDAGGFQCICVESRKSCTLVSGRRPFAVDAHDSLIAAAFIKKKCSSGSVWFNGEKWCVCVQAVNNNIGDRMFCTSNPLNDNTLQEKTCPENGNKLWKEAHRLCACSVYDTSVCISTLWKDIDEKIHRKHKTDLSSTTAFGLRRRVISIRDITSGRFASDNDENERHSVSDWNSRQGHLASAVGARDLSCGGRPAGARWTDSCNMCICTNSRVALCTAKYCARLYGRHKVHR